MRSPARLVIVFILLVALCCGAGPALASQIFGTCNASLSGDPGFEGLYRYDIDITWNIDAPDMNRADIFIELEALDDSCSCVVVRFDQPAGTSAGLTCADGNCLVSYGGRFFCTSEAQNPLPNHAAAARFRPIEQSCGDAPNVIEANPCSPNSFDPFFSQQSLVKCTMGNQGSGHYVFYSDVAPSLPRLYNHAINFAHGNRIEVGDLFGSLPGGGETSVHANAPVAINEFMVKPNPDESEFIELFNTTPNPIDISNWKLIVTNGSYESDYTFPDGTTLGPGAFIETTTMSTFCTSCILATQGPIGTESGRLHVRPTAGGVRAQDVGDDFLFDEGGVIQLEDVTAAEVDRVGYGNLGGAPISCPLVVPAGATPPPGFGGAARVLEPQITDPETLSTSTSRTPDGADSGLDQNDFNIGAPTPDGTNSTVAAPDLGGSLRISEAYLFPRNDDTNPKNESVAFFNPTQNIINLQNLHLSDGTLIQPMISADHEVPLEPGKELTFYHGLNATISFEFEADDRMDVYTSTPAGLVRVDQLGWSQLPSYFPDSCLVRVPEGSGPAGGWDWVTSGGDVNLFYEQCNLEAVPTAVNLRMPALEVALGAASPNPARGDVAFEITVGGSAKQPVLARVGIFDVAGRLVQYVGTGFYQPGHYRAVWNGKDATGAAATPGVYFARVIVGGQAVGESRPVVRVRG